MIRKPRKIPANRSVAALYARLHGLQVPTQAEPPETRQNADLAEYGQQDTFDNYDNTAAQVAAFAEYRNRQEKS